MSRLVLFDIDGTLISDRGASREAFATALCEVYGYEGDLRRYDFSGRTDPQITHMVLRDAGYSPTEIDARIGDLWEIYTAGLERNAAQPGLVRDLPGMRPLLEALVDESSVVLALLTGNIERGARLKLGPPRFNDYFAFGAFGSDSADRNALPPIAVSRALAATGRSFVAQDVVIIGDSIYDVRCGVPHGATTIAVASGKTAGAILRAEGPTHFFESAEDTEAMLRAILG